MSLRTPRPARLPLLCSSPARPTVACVDHLAVRRLRRPPQSLGPLSASGTRPHSLWERSRGRHPVRAANQGPDVPVGVLFKQSLWGIVFPGSSRDLGGAGGRGDPPPRRLSWLARHLICISKTNFCRTSPAAAAAVAPTGFARVMVMLQLLLRALLAFQHRVVPGGVRALPEPPGVAGQRQQQ